MRDVPTFLNKKGQYYLIILVHKWLWGSPNLAHIQGLHLQLKWKCLFLMGAWEPLGGVEERISITAISSAPQEWSRGATASLPFPACTLKIGQGMVTPEVMLVGVEV